jgi:hypothetical protein
MNAWQHRTARIEKYAAKLHARLRAADTNVARLEAICEEKTGGLRVEWEHLLELHGDAIARFKEELADYKRMRDETLHLKGELEDLQPHQGQGKAQIEKRITALLGALSLHLEQVVANFTECMNAFRDYETLLSAMEHSDFGPSEMTDI